MTFNNSRSITGLRIRLFIVTVILLAYIVLTYIAGIIRFPVLGVSDTLATSILVVIYLGIAFYPMALDYQYLSYSDDGDKIVFRYFSSGFIGGKKHSVEIRKEDFAGYRVDKHYFGLKRSITLFHQLPQGVAKYPPIYITALNSKERSRLLGSLFSHTPGDAEEVNK